MVSSSFKENNTQRIKDYQFLANNTIIRLKGRESNTYDYFVSYFPDVYKNYGYTPETGAFGGLYSGYAIRGYYYFTDEPLMSSVCYNPGGLGHPFYLLECDSSVKPGDSWFSVSANKAYILFVGDLIATCPADSEFNTQTKKCEAPCPSGQSWDQANNRCYTDCTDKNKNKWGFADGSCIDCSGEKEFFGVLRCFCRNIGSDYSKDYFTGASFVGDPFEYATCDNGVEFQFKDPKTPDIDDLNSTKPNTPNSDSNSTKPNNDNNSTTPKNPNSDNNSTKPSNGNNPNNSNNDSNSTTSNNSGNPSTPNSDNNSTLSALCRKIPDDPRCKKSVNDTNSTKGSDGSSKGSKEDGEVKFNEGDYKFDDLEKGYEGIKDQYKGGVDKLMDGFDKFRGGVEKFIDNVQGKGATRLSGKSIPSTCSKKYTFSLNNYQTVMDFDFCKIVHPSSTAFYHIFYLIFFLGFLFLIIKLLILSF